MQKLLRLASAVRRFSFALPTITQSSSKTMATTTGSADNNLGDVVKFLEVIGNLKVGAASHSYMHTKPDTTWHYQLHTNSAQGYAWRTVSVTRVLPRLNSVFCACKSINNDLGLMFLCNLNSFVMFCYVMFLFFFLAHQAHWMGTSKCGRLRDRSRTYVPDEHNDIPAERQRGSWPDKMFGTW